MQHKDSFVNNKTIFVFASMFHLRKLFAYLHRGVASNSFKSTYDNAVAIDQILPRFRFSSAF